MPAFHTHTHTHTLTLTLNLTHTPSYTLIHGRTHALYLERHDVLGHLAQHCGHERDTCDTNTTEAVVRRAEIKVAEARVAEETNREHYHKA